MLANTSRWSHAHGNTVVPSRWQATGGMGLPGAASGRPPGSMLGHLFESLATLCIRVPGPFSPEQEKNQL